MPAQKETEKTTVYDSVNNLLNGKAASKKGSMLLRSICGKSLCGGNKITILMDGASTYDAMFHEIKNAKDHINIETFIFDDDDTGKNFANLLIKKQNEGVQVKIIFDSVGCITTFPSFFRRMKDSGIEVCEYNPINPFKARIGWNIANRDHRKIMVIDGRVAFTGGINISNEYCKDMPRKFGRKFKKLWRDTHIRIEGPIVGELQRLFLMTWKEQKGSIDNLKYYPKLSCNGKYIMGIIGSSPIKNLHLARSMYLDAFSHAKSRIHLTITYFVPGKKILRSLMDAAERGVDVKIIFPGTSDVKIVFYAGRSYYKRLLQTGIRLFVFRKDLTLHAKTAIIDKIWSTIGSSNMDNQSFIRNDEINAVILGREFASEMEAMFKEDLAESNEIFIKDWVNRPFYEKALEWLFNIIRYWL